MTAFERYGMVDWSAAAAPRLGADSIWIAIADRERLRTLENPPTRRAAMARISELARDTLAAGERMLLGFDFPFGYPQGTAARMGLAGAPWRAIWRHFAGRVADSETNANNRFAVASDLNRAISGQPFPFWGHPHQHRYACLGPRKPKGYGGNELAERRGVDRRIPRAKSVWQLAYNGSVGSQAMLGLKHLWALRNHPEIGERIGVWPFETGLATPEPSWPPVVLVEIYPSLLPPADLPDKPVDARQVVAVTDTLRRLDLAERLGPLFTGPCTPGPAARQAIETEEAWILGVRDGPGFAAIPEPV